MKMEEVSSSKLRCVPLSALALLEHMAAAPYGGGGGGVTVTVSLCAVISHLSLISRLSLCPNENKKKRGGGSLGSSHLVLLLKWESGRDGVED